MTKSLRWIGAEVNEIPSYHGLTDIQDFLEQFEQHISSEQRIPAMDLAVHATPARWWYAHKENIVSWENVKRLMAIRFSDDREYVPHKYTGESDPRSHIQTCEQDWSDIPEDEWVH